MTPRLTRLRIVGFKSFAEPVSLDILPGLTGIVGPNGCGKSNVVEALRWAMGETSARSLRGGEMDDVIFAGTTARASRNLAEVTVTLESGSTQFPAPFEAEAELQVTRRIERGAGSVFRAQGRELRARDVQTLYADLASGARSSGMVSQGRVADLVRARPEERRQVLEEAAGITGLHARRHEAEMKLRAAEQNVGRAGDLKAQLDGTRESLRRQARQAVRYRAVSGLIRAAEAEHLAILHAQAEAALRQARTEYLETDAIRAALRDQEGEAAASLASADAALPNLRERAAAARSARERCRFEAENQAAQARRAEQEVAAAEARVNDLASDLAAAVEAEHDAAQAVQRLSDTVGIQAGLLSALPGQAEVAEDCVRQMRADVAAAQVRADETAGQLQAAAARAEQASAALQAMTGRLSAAYAQHDVLLTERKACENIRIGVEQLAQAAAHTAGVEALLPVARSELDAAEAARAEAAGLAASARASVEQGRARRLAATLEFDQATARAGRLRTELRASEEALQLRQSGLLDKILVSQANQAAEQADAALADAEAALDRAERASAFASSEAAHAKRSADDAQAARARTQAALSAAQSRTSRIQADLETAMVAWEAAGPGPDSDGCAQAAAACACAEQAFVACETEWAEARKAQHSAVQGLDSARDAQSRADADARRLSAEAEGLQAALGGDDDAPDLLDALQVPDGLEMAFAAALGDAAGAALGGQRPQLGQAVWRSLPPIAPAMIPAGSVALASLLAVPNPLARFLSHVALLDSADGDAVQLTLAPGMVAVNRSGASWRWDGLVTPAAAPKPAAIRLGLRRRLAATRARLADAVARAEAARARLAAADEKAASSSVREAAADRERSASESAWHQAEQAAGRKRDDAVHAASMRATLQASLEALRIDLASAEQTASAAQADVAAVPDLAALNDVAAAAQTSCDESRQAVDDARAARLAARMQAMEAHRAAQALAGQVPRAEALFEAASDACRRAAADAQEAAEAVVRAEAALKKLPDPAMFAAALSIAAAADTDCRAKEAEARRLRQRAEAEIDRSRQAETQLGSNHARIEMQYATLCDRVQRSQAELDDARRQEALARNAVSALADGQALSASAAIALTELEAARSAARQAEEAVLALEAERNLVERVHTDARADHQAWARRLDDARSRRAAIHERHRAAHAGWCATVGQPGDAAEQTACAARALDKAEQAQCGADEEVLAADQRVRILSDALRRLSERASVQRAAAARMHASCEARNDALAAVLARAAERLGPATLPPTDDHSDQAEERARRKHERLCREREEVGAVNLRAETELEELDRRIAALDSECQELSTVIAKLRGAIGHLNKEGRERLLAVFAQVDQHFRALFTRMMGGGRAHLAMTGMDDPLAAGLEIYAEPPGKKLSALSLLSGGEQALTALSLIFAVFRCTPAPLCVLDEVDAPLDDANVARFCNLLDEMVRDTGTSFLVVTHHQLTMSRMDRLFGVTMQERGVSRLLSVDLQNAAAMVSPVLQAAE